MNDLIILRDEMREGFAEMRRETRQGFEGLRAEISELRQDVIALRTRIDALEQRVGVLEQRVTATGLLLEALRDQVRQLAWAHAFLAAQVERQDVTNQQLALLRASCSELDRRVTRLETQAGQGDLPGTSSS
jgi:chromosome segregation ATPase